MKNRTTSLLPPYIKVLSCCLSFISLTCIHTISYAQSGKELEFLVFEPQPLYELTQAYSQSNNTLLTPIQGRSLSDTTPSQNTIPSSNSTKQAIAQYEQALLIMESEYDPYHADLMQNLLVLGDLQMQIQEYQQAINNFQRAEHIARINYGLNSTEQFPVIKKIVQCHLALLDYEAAVDKQEYLISLMRKEYGPQAEQALVQQAYLGDIYLEGFQLSLDNLSKAKGFTISISSSSTLTPEANTSPADMIFVLLDQAQNNYAEAIYSFIQNSDYTNPELSKLENRLLETIYLQSYRNGLKKDNIYFISKDEELTGRTQRHDNRFKRASYKKGKEVFSRLMTYLENDPESSIVDKAELYLRLADWNLLYGHKKDAFEVYQYTYEYLAINGIPVESLNKVFDPDIPVQLPVFVDTPHSREQIGIPEDLAIPYEGYIDVSFTINEYGMAKNIQILNKTSNVTSPIQSRLLKRLKNAPYRLAVNDTKDKKVDSYTLRYNFAYEYTRQLAMQ